MEPGDGEIEQKKLKQQQRNKNVKRDEKPGLILLSFALFQEHKTGGVDSGLLEILLSKWGPVVLLDLEYNRVSGSQADFGEQEEMWDGSRRPKTGPH